MVVCFFTAMTDSGSGLILVPIFTWCGLTPVQAIAAHKFEATVWTAASAIRYIRSNQVLRTDLAWYVVLGCLGTIIGARFIHLVSNESLRTIVGVAILAVSCSMILLRRKKSTAPFTARKRIFVASMMFFFGIYEGILGSGNGYFMAALFLSLTATDELKLVGMITVTAAAWNFAAVCTHFTLGSLVFHFAIPVSIGAAVGAWFGASFAIKKGAGFVRWIIIGGALLAGLALLIY